MLGASLVPCSVAAFDFSDCEREEIWSATFDEWRVNSFDFEFDGKRAGLGFAVGWSQEEVWVATPGHVAFGELAQGGLPPKAEAVRARLRVEYGANKENLEFCPGKSSNPTPLIRPEVKDLTFVCVRRPTDFQPQDTILARRETSNDEYRLLGRKSQPGPTQLSGRLNRVDRLDHQNFELKASRSSVPFEEGLSGAMIFTPAGLVGMYIASDRLGRAIDIETIRQEALESGVPLRLTNRDYFDCRQEQEICLFIREAPRPDALVLEAGERKVTIQLKEGRACTTLPEGLYFVKPRTAHMDCEPLKVAVLGGSEEQADPLSCRLNLGGDWSTESFGELSCTYGGIHGTHCTGLPGIGRGLFTGTLTPKGTDVFLRGHFQSAHPVQVEGRLAWAVSRLKGSIQLQEPGSDPISLTLESKQTVGTVASGSPTLVSPPRGQEPGSKEQAEVSARSFLEALERGEFREIYRFRLGSYFKQNVTEESFVAQFSIGLRQLGGSGVDRRLIDGRRLSQLPGPNGVVTGDFYFIRYKTKYPTGKFYEDIYLELEDGSWMVVGCWTNAAPD